MAIRVQEQPDTIQRPGRRRNANVFRAAPAYYRSRQVRWGLGQLGGAVGLLAGYLLLPFWLRALRLPFLLEYIPLMEALAGVGFLLQLSVSYTVLRLDYELRWYLVSDRGLRIREGVLSTREQTMTFANVQHVGIRQGPLQRLLGIADLEVWTAGGGEAKGDTGEHSHDGGLHVGYLRGVDDAAELRTSILDHLRRSRDSGLGDPDDEQGPLPSGEATRPAPPRLLEAASELLREVRLLRQEATRAPNPQRADTPPG
ncbi:MAG TPA: PH domain-containing protein [Archangium sp.]|uniref:PH domain-containing protein n=1 Tax=Archangium sp. TaxID=1872627 RepID=UPI002E30D1B2|nr:PH domain-containing protein [Archangium sp.]HEX5746616.1 PH domain-containing protein [Archangium sp.]